MGESIGAGLRIPSCGGRLVTGESFARCSFDAKLWPIRLILLSAVSGPPEVGLVIDLSSSIIVFQRTRSHWIVYCISIWPYGTLVNSPNWALAV